MTRVKGKDKPKRTRNDYVFKDMKKGGSRKEDVHRVAWRNGILGNRQTCICMEIKC